MPPDFSADLNTNPETGLTQPEADRRLRDCGFNEIRESEESLWHRVARRFWGPIPGMIEAAALLSAVVRRWEDLSIILLLLVVNVVIDFHQESSALSALKLLKEKLARRALVLRGGRWRELPARELVPGDVVRLRLGAVVPADVKLVGGAYLQIDQSALTGESLPVDKKPGDLAYGNSIVRLGEMTGIVSATGPRTYFGKTVSLVAKAEMERTSHFQKAVIRIGDFLIKLAIAMVAVIIAVSLSRGNPFAEILRFALVLCIASIPVALPAVLSVTMAVGAVRLARRQAIVTRLVSIEELAGVDVLCSDKTGTLTQNRMTLGEIFAFPSFAIEDVLLWAALASRRENNDPLETPIFEALEKSGVSKRLSEFRQTDFTPFDPIRKRAEAVVESASGRGQVVKGAPQAVLSLCAAADQTQADARVRDFAAKGYRALGVAVKKGGDASYQFAGLLPFFDPPRADSAQTIARAKELGLRVKMVTGDNLAIAVRMAAALGVEGTLREASELKAAGPKAAELIEEAGGFAQVLPEDKYLIVDALQKGNRIVAMTGDGVNDAPALKKADAGIAVSGATDAARAAADVVLLSPGLSVIVSALEEARMIFGRMKSYSIFRIAETIRVILFMTLTITVFNFYPVTAVMIIILALLNDIPIMAIAYDNARVEAAPVRWDMREVLGIGAVLGLAGVVSSFLIFFFLERLRLPMGLIQAIIFLKLAVAGHSTIYVSRTADKHFWHKPYPSWKLLVPALGTQAAGLLIAVYGAFMTPVGWRRAGYILAYAGAWFLFNDFVKVAAYKALKRRAA